MTSDRFETTLNKDEINEINIILEERLEDLQEEAYNETDPEGKRFYELSLMIVRGIRDKFDEFQSIMQDSGVSEIRCYPIFREPKK